MFPTCDPRVRPVLTLGALYEQLGRGTLDVTYKNIKALHLLVSEKKNFKVFLLCSYVSNLSPAGAGPVLTPGASYEQSW